MARNINAAWISSTSISVQRRPILSERRPETILPAAFPTAITATAIKADSPMVFFAIPLMLLITINPAPAPMK